VAPSATRVGAPGAEQEPGRLGRVTAPAGQRPGDLAIDSVAADGKDVSWLWDVDFEQLAGKHVICSGPRAYDLAVRLDYGDGRPRGDRRPGRRRALRARPTVPIDVIATYTPFQKLLKMAGLR
jgi:hypothetical protein